jgi:hypothetical protein
MAENIPTPAQAQQAAVAVRVRKMQRRLGK